MITRMTNGYSISSCSCWMSKTFKNWEPKKRSCSCAESKNTSYPSANSMNGTCWYWVAKWKTICCITERGYRKPCLSEASIQACNGAMKEYQWWICDYWPCAHATSFDCWSNGIRKICWNEWFSNIIALQEFSSRLKDDYDWSEASWTWCL